MKTMFREDMPQKLIQSFHARWESSFDSTAFHPGSTWIDIGKETVFPNRSSEGTASTPHVYLWRQKCLEHIQSKFKMDVPRDGMKVSPYPWALLNDVGSMTLEPGKRHPLRFAGLIYSQFYSSTKEILDAAKTYPFADQSLEGLAVDPSLHKEWQREAKHFGCKWSAQKARQNYGSAGILGNKGLKEWRYSIGKADSPECRWCGRALENLKHITDDCQVWKGKLKDGAKGLRHPDKDTNLAEILEWATEE
ncbi:hypothetical protein BDZ91DRAFT_783506 [Kalaharituber pfeilii]|nr:hypothetical protein BDZ91DRAFT_783506 [Kalaharituber pfeilii]